MFKVLNLIKKVKHLVFVFFISACIENAPMDSLSPEGPYARTIDDLFWLTFWIAVVIFIIVQGVLIIAVIFFRDKEGMPEPKQIQGNHKLELLWTIIPVLILGAIAFPTVRTIFDLAKEPEGALNVEIVGHQWWFEINYPEYGITTANILVIPEGTPVRLEMWSEDVMHNFWVPKLNGKRYLVPGQKTYLNLFADNSGEYWAQCGEYCGLSHSKMRARVISLSSTDFEKWIENEQKNAIKPLEGSLAAKGEEIYLNAGCTQCHVINGIWDVLGGASFNNNKEDLTAWLANPAAIKPGTFMPNLELTEEEIDALIEYLGSLK